MGHYNPTATYFRALQQTNLMKEEARKFYPLKPRKTSSSEERGKAIERLGLTLDPGKTISIAFPKGTRPRRLLRITDRNELVLEGLEFPVSPLGISRSMIFS